MKRAFCGVLCLCAFLLNGAVLRFEAEKVLKDPASLPLNVHRSGWSLWSQDKNAKAWSGGVVLRNFKAGDMAPEKADRLYFEIPVRVQGRYALFVRCVRNVGFSIDGGKSWMQVNGRKALIPAGYFAAGAKIKVIAANCFATPGNKGTVYVDCFELVQLPEPRLENPAFAGDVVKGQLKGWHFYTVKKSQLRKEGKAVELSSEGPGWSWLFINNSRIACRALDRFSVTCKAVNKGNKRSTVQLQFVGYAGHRIVNHNISEKAFTLKPGEAKSLSLAVVVPEQPGLETVAFRLVGYPGKISFSDFQFRSHGNSLEAFAANKFNFSSVSNWRLNNGRLTQAGKQTFAVGNAGKALWTLSSLHPLPALAGKGLRIRFTAAGSGARVRVRAVGLLEGEQCRMALNPANFVKLEGNRETAVETVAFLPATACSHIRLDFDGTEDVVLKNLSVELAPRPRGTELSPRKVNIREVTHPRKEGRGLIVRPLEDGRLYASWRLTSLDHKEIAFDIFAEKDGKKTRLNADALRQTTDFIIEKPVADAVYVVAPRDLGHGVTGRARADKETFRSFKLSDPMAKIWSITCADLDGDGEYEYVVRAATDSTDPWHTAWRASKKPFFIEAFARDGRRLWTYDLSFNVESGVWYTPFTVGDFNGDGKDEVAFKGSDWSEGDWREKSGVNKGKVLAGPEYLIVLDGATGKELARAPWPCREKFFDGYMGDNYAARNQIAVFRPDGKRECILALRGTYGLMTAEAWSMEGGKLVKLWSYSNSTLPRKWWGQGSHATRVADLDGDGRDEVILGAAVLDDDGSPLWTTGLGHPDYIFVSDITKKNPGLEVLSIYETGGKKGGMTCADGRTGKVIWALDKPHRHIHCGYASDMDARFRGWESGGEDSINGGHNGPKRSYHYSPDGLLLGLDGTAPYNNYRTFIPRFAYFDADLQREVIEPSVRDHRGGDCGAFLSGAWYGQFDSEGDWREEIVIRRPGGFRICGTLLQAMDRRVTLMADPVYRYSVYGNASGYSMTPSMTHLLSDLAPNLNLTMLREDQLEITVSAPLGKKASGRLVLTAPEGVKLRKTDFKISLAPGEIKTWTVKVANPRKDRRFIRAGWHLACGTVLKGQVPAASKNQAQLVIPRSDIHVEAEDFISEEGGTVRRRSDKKGMHKKCISHWDDKWHIITWRFSVKKAGRYTLMLRSASGGNAQRRLYIDGKAGAVLDISGTGGNGDTYVEWQSQYPLTNGRQVFVDLKEGTHTLSLENLDGNALNLDCILLKRI